MSKFIEMTGKKFGMLTVVEKTDKIASNGEVIWKCKCSCSNETICFAMGGNLRKGFKNSCGCIEDPESPEYWKRVKIRLEKRSKFEKNCIVWTGAHLKKKGLQVSYGFLNVKRGTKKNMPMLAHRAQWIIHNGRIPDGLDVCHKCDNRSCIRIDHLFLGTRKENMEDCIRKKRNIFGEKCKNAKLTEEQAKEIKNLKGSGIWAKELCLKYGVKPSTVKHIWYGERWKHI